MRLRRCPTCRKKVSIRKLKDGYAIYCDKCTPDYHLIVSPNKVDVARSWNRWCKWHDNIMVPMSSYKVISDSVPLKEILKNRG